ncbi:MAG: type II secretion system F family protein [Eubacteriales bacterium]
MEFLAVSIACLTFVLILLIFYIPASRADDKVRRLNKIRNGKKAAMDEELGKPFHERVIMPAVKGTVKAVASLFPKNRNNKNQKLERSLRLAGFRMNVSEFGAVRVIIIVCTLTGIAGLLFFLKLDISLSFLIFIFALLVSFATPIVLLRVRTQKRQEEMTHQLPDVMDLLSVSIEAGLGFDAALIKIIEKLDGVLVDELSVTIAEIQLGKTRRDALKNLAERCPIEDLKVFVSAVIQAEQLGIPIKNVLIAQSQQLRTIRRQKAEEKAMKAPVKMLLPLMLFVFPVLFIVLLGPTMIRLMEQFS